MNRETSTGSKVGDVVRTVFLTDILKGLGVTLKHMLKKPVTYQYPENPRPISDRWRGMHQFMVDDAGRELCVACGMCSAVCPSEAIMIEPGEREDHSRYPAVYEIEVARCIYCGYCQEVCPYSAIVLTTNFHTTELTRDKLVYDKQDLIVPKWEREGDQ
jgi:NADH-quinone oxidoreductase chain I